MTILTEAPVEKLIIERENSEIKCKGVEVKTKSGIESFLAKKEVILSAGAVASLKFFKSLELEKKKL